MSDFLSPIIHAFYVESGASKSECSFEADGQYHDETLAEYAEQAHNAEALVFGCFSQLMQRVGSNFLPDQSGIRAQLSAVRRLMRVADRDLFRFYERTDPSFYSVYRWLLVQFKREVPYRSVSRLWELFWLDHVAPGELHLYVVVALLCAQREQILQLPEGEFDQILRFVNSMARRFDVAAAAHLAARLYLRVGRVHGEASAPHAALHDEPMSPATLHLLF
uniref:Rab-GAP TBC domain-containing protein n=1 Tax=Erythrolobus australicus TaxID=1077150 RepID=A0A7S1TM99_9RHOD|mmetsp:Transcript_4699/g.12653  ORF Transcript_4699/g.12653 Transcript_4699/m.12653 type:complete len:221 (+) Transcript_4699:1-663(+)